MTPTSTNCALGAGKSSTISLIERFFDPTSGQVYLDGQDIRKEAVRNHRARLALVVSQLLACHSMGLSRFP
jgi:ABC-type multidrug transport system fused ATPase/permease subunit